MISLLLCMNLKSELTVFYLNDGTLGGNDLQLIEEASCMGLQVSRSKTELICPDVITGEFNLFTPSSLRFV